ncbi:DUF1801 domain-containing protein [Sphingobium sp. H39-3-25]|uniref:DUF1801 domain-containing protein n=1 Tax=Sphingobium arseniciresistens TaxID=3030834 RepID=UPI0023B92607|nr:DUF1801 domain-containing protein [Sphingobium arseniciresistens]
MADAIDTFEQIVALEPQHDALMRALRALVFELHPDLVEVARPGDRAVSWGWGPKKMSEAYACALPYKDHVNLAFYRGADLDDPADKLRGTGKAMRHISLTQLEQIKEPAVRELLVTARKERQQALRK